MVLEAPLGGVRLQRIKIEIYDNVVMVANYSQIKLVELTVI